MVKFKNEDECVECKKELNELNDMDVDVEITPVELSEDDLAGQTISLPISIISRGLSHSFNL